MLSGLYYLKQELPYKNKQEWFSIILSIVGILFASINLFNGYLWVFCLLGGLNLCVGFSALLKAYRYLPLSPFSIFNLVGMLTRYTAFKREQEILIARLIRINSALNAKTLISNKEYVSMRLEWLNDLIYSGELCIKKREEFYIEKQIRLHNLRQEEADRLRNHSA